MKISSRVHQIRIDFCVTEQVKRYVYVYLLEGAHGCYLIDSGTAGAENDIEAYMKSIGREPLKAVFLTHAHPDHIGAAHVLQDKTGCQVYAGARAVRWTENPEQQFRERPIPNFWTLVGGAAKVNRPLADGETVALEPGMTLRVQAAPGHSDDSVCYIWEEEKVAFLGDAVPAENDLPILTDYAASLRTLDVLGALEGVAWYCPAWDRAYSADEIQAVLAASRARLERLCGTVRQARAEVPDADSEDIFRMVCARAGMEHFAGNPLFRRSVQTMDQGGNHERNQNQCDAHSGTA
ncbi:MAG: MBL fold metallo-hydrolase [Butyricicoccus sp.]